jgi:hypothetical protein
MTIADSPLLGQSASGLNFYDDSRRNPLVNEKHLFRNFSSASGHKLLLAG